MKNTPESSALSQAWDVRADTVYRCIIDYKRTHDGNSPTVRYIQDACSIPSLSTVYKLIQSLEDAGLVRLPAEETAAARSIEVVGGHWTPPQEGKETA